jgi:transposase
MELTQVIMPPSTVIRTKYVVTLTDEERADLIKLTTTGRTAARIILHAQVLLKADGAAGGPRWTDEEIRTAFGIGLTAIARIRQRFVEDGLDAALHRRPARTPHRRKLDGRAEAHLIALACSTPPDGRDHWTMALLAEHFVALGVGPAVSDETVRRLLKKQCPQAVVGGRLVHPTGAGRGVRGCDGGRARRL